MIQVVDEPRAVSLSRNPIVYRWRALDGSGDPYRTIGVRSELRCAGYDGPDNGEELVLNWTAPDGTTGSVTFTADNALNSNTDIWDAASGGFADWTSYYTAIGLIMKSHPDVGPLFNFYTANTGAGQSFWVEAIDLDDDWSVSWDITDISDPAFTVVNTTTVTASTVPDNYRLLWDVVFEADYLDTGYDTVASGELQIDASSEMTLDISRIIDAELRQSLDDPPIPAYGTDEITDANITRRYYVRYREEYDGIVSPAWTSGTEKLVLCGGVSAALHASTDFLGSLDADDSLLTWQPDGRTVSPTQQEYLAWYNYTANQQTIILEVNTYEADGTQAPTGRVYAYESTPYVVGSKEVALIPIGLGQLGISDTDIASYTVRVLDERSSYPISPTYLSQLRTYYVDRSYQEEERFILYHNSFCCPETLRCIGYHTTEMEVSRDKAERILEADYTTTTRQHYQWDEEWRDFFTYRTGFQRKVDIEALRELLIYNRAWEIFDEGYIPLDLQDTSFAIHETRQGLHSQVFTAAPALLARNYSPLSTAAGTTTNRWLNIAGGYWLTVAGENYSQVE